MDDISAYQAPTDAEIEAVETDLNFAFPTAYKDFLKSGGNVAHAMYEPALVRPGIDRLHLPKVAREAWQVGGVSRDWLPFIQDNGDYFILSSSGEVRFWSQNGLTNERWPHFKDWFQQCCVERR